MGIAGRDRVAGNIRLARGSVTIMPPVSVEYHRDIVLKGQDAVQELILDRYGVDVDEQQFFFDTDKLSWKAAGYEGDSFEAFTEDAYAAIMQNLIKNWTLSGQDLEQFMQKFEGYLATTQDLSPLEEQAYLLSLKMLHDKQGSDKFFELYKPYRAIGVGKAQHGGDLALVFLPRGLNDIQESAIMTEVEHALTNPKPQARIRALMTLAANGSIGMLREEIKVVSLGSDTFFSQGERTRKSIDGAMKQLAAAAGKPVGEIDFRKIRDDAARRDLADTQSDLYGAMLEIYHSIPTATDQNGKSIAGGYGAEAGKFRYLSDAEISAMTGDQRFKLFNGKTFRKAYSAARTDPAMLKNYEAVQRWDLGPKKEYVEARMLNFQGLSEEQQYAFLTLEASMAFTGLREVRTIKKIIDRVVVDDPSWKKLLHNSCVQSYIDITRTGVDSNGSFIEYHKGFRGFLNDILGFGGKNKFKLTLEPSKDHTNLHYSVLNTRTGKSHVLYGQANNTSVDANHVMGKLTYNHKPGGGFDTLFPTVKKYLH
jgi:hypothetical protein